ncbi:MAG TPA: endolytic transglycosylase MltG [Candidatus Paceibacterota bacterium]|nr:endolytic transglycosylase MltG [Candidatus Paceibacterota bacterium]
MRFPFSLSERFDRRAVALTAIGGILVIVLLLLAYSAMFGPVAKYDEPEEFIVNPDTPIEEVAAGLKELNFIKSELAFRLAYAATGHDDILEGGYRISRSQDAWTIAEAFARPPYLSWVIVPPGMRKEQIGELLQRKLGWSEEQLAEWGRQTAVYETLREGVYYGDTYLIASDQPIGQVANRLRGRFEEVFAPYADEAAKKGLSWNEVITMASLVERESAKNDKALVAGILWNRIDIGMALQVDATLQYIRGRSGLWWPTPMSDDKFIDSPFNTYKYPGLPPHAIANPSLDSIKAVLDPEETNCIYYLHDNDGQIHCSASYAGQLRNVDRYLR